MEKNPCLLNYIFHNQSLCHTNVPGRIYIVGLNFGTHVMLLSDQGLGFGLQLLFFYSTTNW